MTQLTFYSAQLKLTILKLELSVWVFRETPTMRVHLPPGPAHYTLEWMFYVYGPARFIAGICIRYLESLWNSWKVCVLLHTPSRDQPEVCCLLYHLMIQLESVFATLTSLWHSWKESFLPGPAPDTTRRFLFIHEQILWHNWKVYLVPVLSHDTAGWCVWHLPWRSWTECLFTVPRPARDTAGWYGCYLDQPKMLL